jgi:CRP/FNR family cyclic AMP-dependent transcriptional regulator
MSPPLMQTLAATPILVGLNEVALELLAREGAIRHFGPASDIVREGDSGHSFFIIATGDVEVIKHQGAPHPVLLAELHAGTFFGEMCVVDPVPRAATVRTCSQVTLIEITCATLYHLFRQMPDQYAILILNVARDMARRLRRLDEAFAARAG